MKMLKINIIFSRSLLIAILLFSIASNISAQGLTYENQIIKTFKASKNATIEITNKYGKIHFFESENDSVKFIVDVLVKSNKIERLEKMKNSINFEFTGTPYFIVGKTMIGSKNNDIVSSIMYDIMPSSENTMQIDYSVYIPESANLKIDNRFGDVYLDDLNGSLNIKISNGDLKANDLKGNSDIEVSFGDAIINSIIDGKITLNYSDFKLINANKITLNSKSSKINITSLNQLKIDSRRDKLNIGKLNELYGSSSFTEFIINDISNEFVLNSKYGSIELEKILPQFKLINITSKYSDLRFYFEKEASFSFDATHKNCQIIFPEEMAKFQQQNYNTDTKQSYWYGNFGKKENPASKVSLSSESGKIEIFYK